MAQQRNVVPLDAGRHSDLHLLTGINVDHLQDQQLIPLVASEFIDAAVSMPIIFVKDAVSGDFRPAGLLGLSESENVLLTRDQLGATYVPLDVRRYPFYVAGNMETGEMTLCIDEASDRLTREEGVPLFDAEGRPSEVVMKMQKLLSDYTRQEVETRALVDFLETHDLLSQRELRYKVSGQERKVGGLWSVNEERLRSTDAKLVAEMHERNFLGAIYAHIVSMANINKILSVKSQ